MTVNYIQGQLYRVCNKKASLSTDQDLVTAAVYIKHYLGIEQNYKICWCKASGGIKSYIFFGTISENPGQKSKKKFDF